MYTCYLTAYPLFGQIIIAMDDNFDVSPATSKATGSIQNFVSHCLPRMYSIVAAPSRVSDSSVSMTTRVERRDHLLCFKRVRSDPICKMSFYMEL